MKVSSSKAISSPARTDKFPPPLMRFLRSNAGNRSSRRSRTSSPILILRRKNNNIETTTTTTTQEPSSPKVTCMGQVKAKPKRETPSSSTRCWWWIKKPKFRPSCLKWPIFRKKPVNSEESNFKFHEEKVTSSVVDNGFAGNNNSSTPPPGNALLLTRCRSAPYRSSSLASRFWSSPPLRNNEESQGEKIDSSITNSEINGEALLSLKGREIVCDEVHPVMLTRCKSEPAGIGYRFDPAVEVEVEVEVNTSSSLLKLKKTSLAFVHTNTVSSPLHVHSD